MRHVPFLLLFVLCMVAARFGLAVGLLTGAGFVLGLFEPPPSGAATALRRALPVPAIRWATVLLAFLITSVACWGLLLLCGPSPEGDVPLRFVVGTYAFMVGTWVRSTAEIERSEPGRRTTS